MKFWLDQWKIHSCCEFWTLTLWVENNRMGKMRAIFKKIGDTKGPFYAKMGTIKDRNSMDLTEADVEKRW